MHRSILFLVVSTFVLVAGGTQAAPKNDGARIDTPVRVDQSFSMRLSNGCSYGASILGDIKPTKSDKACDAGLLEPNVHINAELACPNEGTQRLSETFSPAGPLSRDQLEQAIEARATMASGDDRVCIYQPDLRLTELGLDVRGVAYSCPVPAGQA